MEKYVSKWESDNTLVFIRDGEEVARWEYDGDIVVKKEGEAINGVAKRVNAEGILSAEDNYVDNKENGASKTYYESGQLESIQE
jgi:antitoxin component YwqK of YwqJK toxin-antitoxin module